MRKMLIHNAMIVNEGNRFEGFVLINGEKIETVGRGVPAPYFYVDADVLDAQGLYLLPGAIDTHVHFREPGLTRKASIKTESASAVAGGVTSFLDMPNTAPAAVTTEVVEMKKEIARRDSVANYGFFIGATNSNIDTILEADYTAIPGIKLFMGSSTGDMLVDNQSAIERLFSRFKGVIAVHAEDETTIRDNRRRLTAELGDNLPISLHSIVRSREACVKATRRAVELARRHGTRLHVLHVSTADELEFFQKGDIRSKKITAESCPHYLLFDAAELSEPDGYLKKCNPAIKAATDRDALRQALADRLIDVIATDHAPHQLADKQGSLFKAASGMPGVKFMLPLMLDMTIDDTGDDRDDFTVEDVVEKTAHNPARLYAIKNRGFIKPGYQADLTLVARLPKPETITAKSVTSHFPDGIKPGCDWTPYEGLTLNHRVVATFVNGHLAFDGDKVDMSPTSHALEFAANQQ